MKKKMGVIVVVLIMSLFIGMVTGAQERMTAEEAKTIYNDKTESFQVSREVFETEVEKEDPNKVMFATSIYGVFEGVTLEEIYALYDELGSARAVNEYLIERDREQLRTKQKAQSGVSIDHEAAKENYTQLREEGADRNVMIRFDNEALSNSTDKKEAIKEYENNKDKFIFTSTAELENYLDKRHAGEVLFAGSVAKQFDCEVTYVFQLIDKNNQDYQLVLKEMFNEFRSND